MRFVITVEDVILFGMLAVSVVLMIVGVALSWIEKLFGKTAETPTEQTEKSKQTDCPWK